MGIEAKLSNVSQRLVGRAEEVAGRITHNDHWQADGRSRREHAREDEIRQKAKDVAKAQEAMGLISHDERLRLEREENPPSTPV
ncbi:hypothetical protein [Catellatospora tritici]|uniref:hypothetical protein n=1 Tax=Catellatospora tritici TaxID=2851566 RepID=UPI001C2DD53F|nr:hypothetical protein [Catellatospora tritici]MBV1855463.1 hypothetical protein [Catellatospora tritici]